MDRRVDGYSTALFFARWPNGRLLWPEPLPEGFQPADLDMLNDGEPIRRAVLQQFSIQDEDLEWVRSFDEVLQAGLFSRTSPTPPDRR